jgi:hypothetical protein
MISDFLSFRRMLTPWIIVGFFWFGMFVCFILSLYNIFNGSIVKGLVVLLFVPLIIRIICESLIVFFRINETLTDIKNKGHL